MGIKTQEQISFSIPVSLFDCKKSDNPLYTYAKLKIFYVGMTPDKRLFTKEFSDKLLKSLPLVPVVAYYDKDKEDFVGHKTDVQYIYGVVPDSVEPKYVTEKGIEYAVTDIILYTGREDETGDIAQKIIGKKHSLEMNRKTTTYKINKDSEGKIESIEFIEGTLAGLSVLGDDETPAFTGSEFFTDKTIDFKEMLEGLIVEYEKFNQKRGENTQMDMEMGNNVQVETKTESEVETFQSALDFIKKNYSEKEQLISKTLFDLFGYDYFYIQQTFDDLVVFAKWDGSEGDVIFLRATYTITEDDKVEFGEFVKVIPRFLTKEEIEAAEAVAVINKSNEFQNEETEAHTHTHTNVNTQKEVGDATTVEPTNASLTEEDIESRTKIQEETFKENAQANASINSDATALNNSEREELENYRKEKKLNYVETFTDFISEDFLSVVRENINNYSLADLEVLLSKEFTRVGIEKARMNPTPIKPKLNPLYYNDNLSSNTKDVLVSLIEKYK